MNESGQRQWIQKPRLVIFLVGMALSIGQFIMIRDFVSILYGEEIVIVLVTISFFVGLSIGYLLAPRLSVRVFQWLLVVSIFLHLTFPFSYRYLAAWFSADEVGGWGFLTLLFGYALIFNTMFATFLPRLVSSPEEMGSSEEMRLKTNYTWELMGFISGFALIVLSWNQSIRSLLIPYWIVLGVILFFTFRRIMLTAIFATFALMAMLFLSELDQHSSAMLYQHKHFIPKPQVLYSVNSPYQKIEVVEDIKGDRSLYLDGLKNLDASSLDALNYYIAYVPAVAIEPTNTLLIGNGTLSSVSKVYPYSGSVTSVELDSGVVEAGKQFFTKPEELEGLDRWQLHIDDAKHFLRQSNDEYDLVVVDVPSPLTIQEGYLHTVEFYELVKHHLTEQGVIAVQLSGTLRQNDRTPARVTAALRHVFPEVLILSSRKAHRSFAYASRALPFSNEDLHKTIASYENSVTFIPPNQVGAYLTQATPLTVNSMDLVLRNGWARFTERYF